VEAVEPLQKTPPDLLFLDVQMPEMDGFEVLRRLGPQLPPAVIFTTAYDRHAVRAFDAHALDYLLKPFKPERFKQAVERARAHLRDHQAGSAAQGLLELLDERTKAATYLTRLTVKTADRVLFVNVADVEVIESAGKYAVVQVGKANHILRETMANLEAKLPPDQFLRLSRSAIVNIDCIQELQPMFKGESVVVLKNGKKFATHHSLREIQEKLGSR
jgi:two-component system LytT family response regulator